ncbi:MAG: helix-turn-helix domain-containing protein, partial [Rhodothermales bacterium]
MLQESSKESGTRLARDMRKIREARHLTVQDLHEETKIPQGLIEAFEESALFDHPQFNRVYLRSFVRTYAQVVGIEADSALSALEEALANRYVGSLAVEYLGEAPERASEIDDEVVQPAPEPEEAASAEVDESSEPKRKPRDRSPAKRPKPRKSAGPAKEEPKSPTLLSTTADTAAGYERVQEEAAAESDWTSQSPPGGVKTPARSSRDFGRRGGGLNRAWLIGGGAIVIVAAAIWGLTSLVGVSEEGIAETQPVVDTVATKDTLAGIPGIVLPAPPLGDSLNVQIIAANDKVDPIRITIDDDMRRPYWLNLGDSMSFTPTNRIVVEEQIEDIVLKVEGIEYPTNRRDELGRLVITRDSVQQYFAR